MFSRLYIACQNRDGNLEEFFKYENQPEPPALSEGGKLRSGHKSDLIKCLEKLVEGTSETPRVDAIIMDGAVLYVQMLKPVLRHLESVKRIDVVWDGVLLGRQLECISTRETGIWNTH